MRVFSWGPSRASRNAGSGRLAPVGAFTTAIAIAAATVPALAQDGSVRFLPTTYGPAVDATKLDVAGVALGMSRQQAVAAAEAQSYKCEVIETKRSFAEAVSDAVLERRGKTVPWGERSSGVSTLRCPGSSGSVLDIDFGQVPNGQTVSGVSLNFDAQQLDSKAVTQRALAKYGRRSIAVGDHGAWCRLESPSFNRQCDLRYASLVLSDMGGLRLKLSEALSLKKARDAAIQAEAARLAPASTRPAF